MNFPVTINKPKTPFVNRTIDFAREVYSDSLIEEMLPLWRAHYEEIALYKDIALSPLFAVYLHAEKTGALRIFTARSEGRLVGYEVFFIHLHPHYSSALEAVQDILFLSNEMRHGWIGYRFIRWCDDQLDQTGAKVVFRCVSNMHDYAPLLERAGYRQHDVLYSRRVSE